MAAYFAGNEVGQVVDFPPVNPRECQSASIQVIEEETGRHFTRKAIYIPELGRTFELGRQIKKAIYGEVVAGQEITLVDPMQPTLFRRLPQQVAIKIYNKRKLANPEVAAEKPHNELAAMTWLHDPLKHPHLMPLLVCCHDDVNLYAVMPFLPSLELFDLVEQQGAMSESKARVCFRHLLLALFHCHSRGVAHRDLSLENTLVVPDENHRAVVIDFGMALRVQERPTGGFPVVNHPGICGKRSYISPEVLAGARHVDLLKADLWALGVMLFMLVTGVPPVDTATERDQRFKVITSGRLSMLLEHWRVTGLSPALVELMQGLLRTVEQRLSLQDVMRHPWVCTAVDESEARRGGASDWFEVAVQQIQQQAQMEIDEELRRAGNAAAAAVDGDHGVVSEVAGEALSELQTQSFSLPEHVMMSLSSQSFAQLLPQTQTQTTFQGTGTGFGDMSVDMR